MGSKLHFERGLHAADNGFQTDPLWGRSWDSAVENDTINAVPDGPLVGSKQRYVPDGLLRIRFQTDPLWGRSTDPGLVSAASFRFQTDPLWGRSLHSGDCQYVVKACSRRTPCGVEAPPGAGVIALISCSRRTPCGVEAYLVERNFDVWTGFQTDPLWGRSTTDSNGNYSGAGSRRTPCGVEAIPDHHAAPFHTCSRRTPCGVEART